MPRLYAPTVDFRTADFAVDGSGICFNISESTIILVNYIAEPGDYIYI